MSSWDFYEKCSKCGKPLVNETNLKRLRALIIGSAAVVGILGCVLLPVLGFTTGGIAAGSAAASWQSSIGLVAAGSLFAVLQSLGATGLGILLFGGIGAALGALGSVASRLGWCTCDTDGTNEVNKTSDNTTENVQKNGEDQKVSDEPKNQPNASETDTLPTILPK